MQRIMPSFLPALRATGLAVSIVAASLSVCPDPASAQGTPQSAANLPFSGISPGGVDMATGELILVMRPDLHLDGDWTWPSPYDCYERYYASMLTQDGLASGHLGPNWLGTYDWTLSVVGSNALLVTNRGAAVRFTQGPVGSWDLVSPTYARFKLDALAGGVWRFTNPLDRRLYFFDGTSWLLTQILDEHGNALSLSYSPAGGLLTQVTDGLGHALFFTYDATGHLIQVSDGTRAVHYAYTSGLLTGVTDANGHAIAITYAPSGTGLVCWFTEPLGNQTPTQSYDPLGRVISQTDALGNMATYAYGAPTGNVFTDPLGDTWSFQHDAQGRLLARLDPAAQPTSFAYDALGRLSMVTRPMGDQASFEYDPASGYPSMLTLADGSARSWTYSSHFLGTAAIFDLASAHYPDGTTENYGRDLAGNLTDFTDQAGFHWMGTYNVRGQVLTLTNPSGGVTTFTYDAQGRPTSARDNPGNTTNYAYDALSRLTQVTWPDGTTRMYAYDNLDALTGLTDERGKLWSRTYDENERLMAATDPLMHVTKHYYDALDRVIRVADPLDHSTLYGYDPVGRLATKTDRSGRTTSYQYDALNRLTGVMDPAGGTDAFGWDQDSRMISAQDPLGHSFTYAYDMLDRVTRVTDPVGTEYNYSYDSMGRLHTATAPLGHMETFNYEPRGLLSSFFNSTSETDFPRTSLGEVSQVTDPNHNGWPRTYDAEGRLTGSADPLARATSYEYDALGRVLLVGQSDGTQQQINYDATGRVTGVSYTDGTNYIVVWDDANRIIGGTGASFAYDAAGRMINSNGFAFTYDPEGRVLSETVAAGKTVNYTYDSRGLPSQVMDWMGGGATTFSYDAARRLTGITRPNGTTATYQYDNADRLINAVEQKPGPIQSPVSSIAITRDALGQPASINRRQPLMPGETMPSSNSFSYDAASQLNGATHDALGRTTSAGGRSFQWDGASRLTHYVAGSESPSFTYDAFGQQLTSTQPNQAVAQAWNYGRGYPTNDDLAVTLPNPHTRYLVRAPSGLLLYGVDGSTGERSFYHYDEAGNTAYVTNGGGSVTTEYAYTPYGGVAALGETGDNALTYGGAAAGMTQLGTSGLFRVGGGIYDALTMRGISGTTIGSGPIENFPSPVPVSSNPGPGGGGIFAAPCHGWKGDDCSGIPGASVALNPQPLPPGGSVELNPQPLPPGGSVALNPQPFPPGPCVTSNLGPLQTSGLGEVLGNDAIVTLGASSFQWSGVALAKYQAGSRMSEDAGTFMHELGHNVGMHHGGAFELKDWSFETTNSTTIGSATGGGGAGKSRFGEFQITKTSESASPTFFKKDPSNAGGPFSRFKFDTAFTTRIDWSGPGDEGPEESISFVYGKLGVNYVPQGQSDGSPTPGRPRGGWYEWRFASGSPCTWCAQ